MFHSISSDQKALFLITQNKSCFTLSFPVDVKETEVSQFNQNRRKPKIFKNFSDLTNRAFPPVKKVRIAGTIRTPKTGNVFPSYPAGKCAFKSCRSNGINCRNQLKRRIWVEIICMPSGNSIFVPKKLMCFFTLFRLPDPRAEPTYI